MTMPDFIEIKRSLFGAWRLFCGDPNGLKEFDLSEGGFFRSFAVVILIAPLYIASLITERSLVLAEHLNIDDFSDSRFFLVRALSLIVDWFAFPILMVFVTRQLSLGGRYAAFITVRNWAALPAAALTTSPTLIYGIGLLPLTATTFATFICLVIVLRFGWFIAKTTLMTNSVIAAGIMALDLVLSLVIGRLGDLLAGL